MNDTDLDIIARKLSKKLSFQPRWLKLKPAALYSSIGQNKLIKLAQTEKIIGFQDTDSKRKDWIFDKDSIDTYRLNQAVSKTNHNKIALKIINSLGV